MALCDHRSVGLVLTNDKGEYLLLKRAKPPRGWAPIAGHIDHHGDPRSAVKAEAWEEAGIVPVNLRLVLMRSVDNLCRREPSGDPHEGHRWWVFTADILLQEPSFSTEETRGGRWVSAQELQTSADVTLANAIVEGNLPAYRDGLEPVWADLLNELGLISLPEHELDLIREIYRNPPA